MKVEGGESDYEKENSGQVKDENMCQNKNKIFVFSV